MGSVRDLTDSIRLHRSAFIRLITTKSCSIINKHEAAAVLSLMDNDKFGDDMANKSSSPDTFYKKLLLPNITEKPLLISILKLIPLSISTI